ncbi:MAG TPA: methylated-DNA--[protein]-cysteine S-methyltransferase [Candidatus Eremiobacteraceae bacterium]|nr:methylated-DNA--[protein]-cysteine S-methyltransferase [Candidatus Eremiobacteraceae bacterium]
MKMKIYAVRTTGIYCRPSCPARAPKPENVILFDSTDAARRAGFRACKRCRPDGDTRAEEAVKRAIGFIESHLEDDLPLTRVASAAGMSPTHFQRVFATATGVSPRMYVATRRSESLKSRLKRGDTVLDAAHNAGFSGQKQAYAHANGALGMSPGKYRRGGTGESIVYTIETTKLGKTLIATTERGIAAIGFGAKATSLIADLRAEFPKATIADVNASTQRAAKMHLNAALRSVRARIAGRSGGDVKLDVSGSPFQRKVWQAIQKVRRGSTTTYAKLAKAIGRPKAVRAVASACAANKIALVIPCHRILRSDGSAGGYRWGNDRKAVLLRNEVA